MKLSKPSKSGRSRSTLSSLLACGVAALFLVSLPAAAAPKHSRSSGGLRGIKVKETKRTRRMKKNKKADSELKPEISSDQFISIQNKVQGIRKEQVKLYKRLIRNAEPGDPQLPEYYLRLAEAYANFQRLYRFKAFEMEEKVDTAKRGQKAKLKKQKKRFQKLEQKYLVASIKVYKALTGNKRFRNYPNMDQALFYYAYTLQDAGKKYKPLARTVYKQLITDYPRSKYIPEALLSFADAFFNNNELAKALTFYTKVLEYPKSSVWVYALYKKGWVYLNQTKFQKAMKVFAEVVAKTKRDKKRAQLNRAAKKDFVRAFAERGNPRKALLSFKKLDPKYAPTMLEILAAIYLDQGKAKKAIFAFRTLMTERPKDQKVCEWQYNVVRAMLTIGKKKQKVNELALLVKLYQKLEKTKQVKGTAMDECRENAQETTAELAKLWHNEAIKTLNFETLQHVDKLYNVYLDVFKNAEDFGEMQYFYAELKWKRAENEKNQRLATQLWEDAAMTFTDVVKTNRVSKKLRKDSAYAAVVGWKNALDVDPTPKKLPPVKDLKTSKVPKPKPIPAREKKMIEAFDIYIKYIKDPKDKELVMMKFMKARIFWKWHHLEEAIPMFQDIVFQHTAHESAEYSANILYFALRDLNKHADMLAFAKRLETLKGPDGKLWLSDKDELKENTSVVIEHAAQLAAESLEKDGEFIACGLAWQDIYNRNTMAKGNDKILYNAGTCFEQGRSIGLAIKMFRKLQDKYPTSKHTQRALVRLGYNYAAIARYRQAATYYESYAKKYGGEKDAGKALSNAVLYRKGIGDDAKAIDNTEKFVKKFNKGKTREKAADALFSMAGIYEKQGNTDKLISHLERYIRQMKKTGGADRLIIAHAKLGELYWKKSCVRADANGACVRITRARALRTSKKKKRRRGVQLPTQCGEASKIKLKVKDRDPRMVKRAKKHFKAAIKGFGKGTFKIPGDEGGQALRRAQAVYWFAASNFYMTEGGYEKFLAIKFPKGLNFDPKKPKKTKKSLKKFLDWKKAKDKAAAEVNGSYKNVVDNIKGGGAHWAIASAARIGQVAQNYADALYTAEIPKSVRTGPFAEDMVDVYCDQLTTTAGPLENVSISAYSFCLTTTTKLNWFNSWSRLCERELGQIRPQDFPTQAETHSEPTLLAPVTDAQGIVTTLQKQS